MKEIRQHLHGRDVQGFVVGEPVTSLTGIQGVINNNHEGNITHIGEVTKLHGITCTPVTLDNELTVLPRLTSKKSKIKK